MYGFTLARVPGEHQPQDWLPRMRNRKHRDGAHTVSSRAHSWARRSSTSWPLQFQKERQMFQTSFWPHTKQEPAGVQGPVSMPLAQPWTSQWSLWVMLGALRPTHGPHLHSLPSSSSQHLFLDEPQIANTPWNQQQSCPALLSKACFRGARLPAVYSKSVL